LRGLIFFFFFFFYSCRLMGFFEVASSKIVEKDMCVVELINTVIF